MDAQRGLKAEDLGPRLRAVRELSGARQRDVAKAAGLSRRELQAAERGVKRLSADELHALAGALGVDAGVLLGVGCEGELAGAGSVADGVDRVVGHDPERSGDLPESVDDRPAATPVDLPHPERRKDFTTRNRIEQSWREVRAEMGDTLMSCARLISAGSGDDVRRLIERLEEDVQRLKSRRTFQRNLADHELALQRVRGTGGTVPVAQAAHATTDAT